MSLANVNDSLARLDEIYAKICQTLDEPARLDEVEQVLANFTGNALIEQLINECAAALKVDVCALTLLTEDTQVFMASSAPMANTTRADSYCQFVASSGEALAVPDVTKRKGLLRRVPDRAPLGAYLGVPLVTHDQQLGSLCSLHMKPRKWTTADRLLMEAYSKQITAILEEGHL